MDSNLMLYDVDHFLDKYTRFMTKNIYISNHTYRCFMEQYQYLYEMLEKTRFLYSDNVKYQRMMNIDKNKNQVIKLHNQKYLQKTIPEYQAFFEEITDMEELDVRRKSIILSEEEKMLVIQPKGVESLIIGKIKYLAHKYHYCDNDMFVLTESLEQKNMLENAFLSKGISVLVKTVREYGLSFLKDNETVLDDDQKYLLFCHYFIHDLFSQKDKFQQLYDAFSKYIYLNKDYKEYETFRDYHNYMYKRKFLASSLSLKKFNEQEIKKRRTYLRTIQNEVMKTKEEVDIANFLYLNSIFYQYHSDTSSFLIWLDNKKNQIQYFDFEESFAKNKSGLDEDIICLYSSYTEKKSCLEVLVYELIKRRYPFELVDEKVLYNQLKDTTIENYFSEFIRKYLIPTINYYEEYQSLKETRLTLEQQQIMIELYSYYERIVEEGTYVREKELFFRMEKDIVDKNYRYLFLWGDISFQLKVPTLMIVSDYQEVQLLKENIKLLYDYKKYLYKNQVLPIAHTYLNYQELNQLTGDFLKENLTIINKALEENKKEIEIQYYDDFNRLHVYQNISECCYKVLKEEAKNVLFAFMNLKDMNLLVSSNLFSKKDKSTLVLQNKREIPCEEVLKISKLYQTIVLPYLMIDSYHEDLLKKDYDYHIKVMLYVALCKCREKIILLCPKSRKQELRVILKNLKKPVISG